MSETKHEVTVHIGDGTTNSTRLLAEQLATPIEIVYRNDDEYLRRVEEATDDTYHFILDFEMQLFTPVFTLWIAFLLIGATWKYLKCQRWIIKFVSFIEEKVRRRKKPVGKSWRIDETYIKAQGKWVYLYRAVDKYGNTIDFLLKEYRDLQAAKAFFKKSINRNGEPESVVIDKSGSNLAALKSINKNKKESDKIKINRSK